MVVPAWHATHPDHSVMRRAVAKRSFAGERDLFATALLDAPKAVFSYLPASPFAGVDGHIVIRVAPGGASYQVFVIDAENEAGEVQMVRSYTSR
jgi:hypothetical protein